MALLNLEDIFGGGGGNVRPFPGQPAGQPPPTPIGDSAPLPPLPGTVPQTGLGNPYYAPSEGGLPGGPGGALSRNRLSLDPADPELRDLIRSRIRGAISGRDVPYTPEMIAKIKGNALAAAKGQVRGNVRAADRGALQRGIYRSSVAAGNEQSVRDTISQSYVQATEQVDVETALANYNARTEAIAMGRQYLDDLSRDLLTRAGFNLQSDQLGAELTLAYERIASQERLEANRLLATLEQMLLAAGLEG